MRAFFKQNFTLKIIIAVACVLVIVPVQLFLFRSVDDLTFYILVPVFALLFFSAFLMLTKRLFLQEVTFVIEDNSFTITINGEENKYYFDEISSVIYMERRLLTDTFYVFHLKSGKRIMKIITAPDPEEEMPHHPLALLYNSIRMGGKLLESEYSSSKYWEMRKSQGE